MSANNGVIKITRRSLMKFQFGDDQPVLEFDVIAVADQWHEVNFALRVLENDMWVLPPNKTEEYAVNRLNFVQALVDTTDGTATLTRIEAEEFIRRVYEEAEKLRNFTSPKTAETSSVLESTERVSNFSQ